MSYRFFNFLYHFPLFSSIRPTETSFWNERGVTITFWVDFTLNILEIQYVDLSLFFVLVLKVLLQKLN